MKKIKFLAAFVAFSTLLGLTSCSDDQAELLGGGQGPAGTIILNVNYTIPGQDTKVFHSTFVSAEATDDIVTITAKNEETGENLVIAFGNQMDKNDAFADATVTYIDPSGNEYSAYSPFTSKNTGVVKLSVLEDGSLTGAFSLVGYDDNADSVADGVPFFSGIFEKVPLTGDLPEPIPYISMKANVDGTDVIFRSVSTMVEGDKSTFRAVSTDPAYEITFVFNDNTTIEVGSFPIDDTDVTATVKVGADTYEGVNGFITITSISDDIATGTFSITAENEDGTITVNGGKFNMDLGME
jgi:hypothetical protein